MISIIVPIYKVEAFLRQCIESIILQTFSDWELLLIDDGSPDSCGAICDEYACFDKRIRVFHINNGGVSNARNTGIERAKGDWITFIDGDDWVDPCYLAQLISPIRANNDIEFVQSGYYHNKKTEQYTIEKTFQNNTGSDPLFVFNNYEGFVFAKMFKREVLINNQVRFVPTIRIGEDYIFTLTYIKYIKYYSFIDYSGYYYRYRESSALNSIATRPFCENLDYFRQSVVLIKSFANKHSFDFDDLYVRWNLFLDMVFYRIRRYGFFNIPFPFSLEISSYILDCPTAKYQSKLVRRVYLYLFAYYVKIQNAYKIFLQRS